MISDLALGCTKTLPQRLLPLQSLCELGLLHLFRGFVRDGHLVLLFGFALTRRLSAQCFQRMLHTIRTQDAAYQMIQHARSARADDARVAEHATARELRPRLVL